MLNDGSPLIKGQPSRPRTDFNQLSNYHTRLYKWARLNRKEFKWVVWRQKLFTEIGRTDTSRPRLPALCCNLFGVIHSFCAFQNLLLSVTKRDSGEKGGVTRGFLMCLALRTETTEVMAATFQTLRAQNKKADLTCETSKSEESVRVKITLLYAETLVWIFKASEKFSTQSPIKANGNEHPILYTSLERLSSFTHMLPNQDLRSLKTTSN